MGSTTLVDAGISIDTTPPGGAVQFILPLSTNNGTYTTSNGANAVSLFEIERIDVTGTNQGDIIAGTGRILGIGSPAGLFAQQEWLRQARGARRRCFTGLDFNAAYVTYVNGPVPLAAIRRAAAGREAA